MPRLFVAVWPPPEVLDRLGALSRPEADGVRWTGRDQWHVTLRFLGPVADTAPVSTALATVEAGPTVVRLGPAVDRFAQRVLHVPVSGLEGLATAVVAATAGLGRPPEDRPFHGHVTLARTVKHARVDLRTLTGQVVDATWEVGSICLVESRLSSAGARYEVLEELPVPSAG